MILDAPAAGIEVRSPRPGRVTFSLGLPPGTQQPELISLLVSPNEQHQGSGWSAWRKGEGFDEGEFAPGPVQLIVMARGFAPAYRNLVVEAGGTVSLGEIQIDPGREVRGHVFDEGGVPIAGAWVSPHSPWVPDSTAKTDGDGGFVLAHIPPGPIVLGAQADGYLPGREDALAGAEGVDVRISLRRGALIRVDIELEGGGEPYSPAIRVVDLDAPAESAVVDWMQNIDAGGHFDVTVPAGRYRVELLRGYNLALVADESDIEVGKSEDVCLEVGQERSVRFVQEWD